MQTRNDVPDAGMAGSAQQEKSRFECAQKSADLEPSLREWLEGKRNRLTRELVEVEEALRLVYSDPNVERIHETLKRARV